MRIQPGPNAISLGGFDMAYLDGAASVVVSQVDGWFDLPEVRSAISDRPGVSGGFDGKPLYSSRVITLSGTLSGATQGDAIATRDALAGLLYAGDLLTLTVDHEQVGELSVAVRPSGGINFAPAGGSTSMDFSITVTAPDPLKYGALAFAQTDLSDQSGTGLVYAGETVLRTNLAIKPVSSSVSEAGPWTATRGTLSVQSGFLRLAITDANTGGGAQRFNYTERIPVTAGAVYSASAQSRTTTGQPMRVTLLGYGPDGTTIVARSLTPTPVVVPGPTDFLDLTPVTWTIPAGVVTLGFEIALDGNGPRAIGQTIDMRRVMLVAGQPSPYFDGGFEPTDGKSYRWTGAPNASTSQEFTPGGLQYPLDYGVPQGATPGAVVVANAGTATYWPRLRIDGPVTNPVVSLVETGDWVRYNGSLLPGQWLDIDLGNRTVLLNGSVDVRQNVSSSGNWLGVPTGVASMTWAADDADSRARLNIWSYEGVWS